MLGQTVGKYLFQEELGGGSTAYVYKGIQTDTNRVVAIKMLHTYLLKNSTIVERFRRESKVIERLKHPHIIEFLDYFEDEDHFLYVMEYLKTYTLEDVLNKKKRLPANLALPILCELCEALSYAHALDIVHRDIKPSNLFIARDKGLILSDFGLAKPMGDAPITAVGSKMMGTPHFMAPEQVMGGETDVRTDIYQVGLIIFQTLTGDLPFRDKSHFKAIMLRVNNGPMYAPEHDQYISPRLRAIIDKATAQNPAQRYQTAEDMRVALSQAARSL